MNDLSNYLSQKDRIEALEKVVQAQEDEIKRIRANMYVWKSRYYKLRGKPKKITPTTRAIIDIKDALVNGFEGKVIDQINSIAEHRYLSPHTVGKLWYKVKAQLTSVNDDNS